MGERKREGRWKKGRKKQWKGVKGKKGRRGIVERIWCNIVWLNAIIYHIKWHPIQNIPCDTKIKYHIIE